MRPYILKLVILMVCSLGAGLLFIVPTSAIFIESEESRTKELTPVYNQIKWFSSSKRDVWMMNQSHFGKNAKAQQWERLAIVIDKTKKPMVAKFYQVESGALEWSDALIKMRTPYRASCFTCHNNGPRAIRPQGELSFRDKVKIQLWNLRIKTYGRIHYDQTHNEEDKNLKTPFRYWGPKENDELKVSTCLRCHKEEGFLARGVLVRQQTGTIESMIKRGQMPPPGFKLSMKEKKELKDFLRGF